MITSGVLLIEDHARVRLLTMNRPEKRNALNTALTTELLEAMRAADADDNVAVVVLTGAGQAFCGGADLSEFEGLRDAQAAEARAELTMQLHLSFSRIKKPVITSINGAAVGGGAGLALAGDLALMSENATLRYPETRRGIVPALVLPNLIRQVIRKAAFELVALGAVVDAKRALALGLVNRVIPDADLLPESLAIAQDLSTLSTTAMAETKRLFHEAADLSLAEGLEHGREANKRMRSFAQVVLEKK